jgi:hypothetical protein
MTHPFRRSGMPIVHPVFILAIAALFSLATFCPAAPGAATAHRPVDEHQPLAR